jgi:Zn-dependent protease with chaperone function
VRYRLQVLAVLVSLVLFVLLYLALVAGAAYLVYLSIAFPLPGVHWLLLLAKAGAVLLSALLFLFLLRGLFKRRRADKLPGVEVTEERQPRLFAFIRRLCAETNAPVPHRVFLSPDVNAAVFYHDSLLSLIVPARKNLLIGLGLVNALNLSEFKAVLAHEFGHFSQRSMKLGAYVYQANHIAANVVYGRDWLDDLLVALRDTDDRLALVVLLFEGIAAVLRRILVGTFRVINFLNAALSRQMEFNADLVAVSVTGSDALIHALARLDFAGAALDQAMQDLSAAAMHQRYSRDLFYHQNHAAAYLRRRRGLPHLGEPPPVPDDPRCSTQVFEPGDTGIPLMWASHPSNYDRERNAKRRYLRWAIDERSPWLLFHDPQAVREKVTRRFYRQALKLRKSVPLAPAEDVQAFIDDEHAETTYAARYHGLYDGRFLEPGPVHELEQLAEAQPWPPGLLREAHAALYPEEWKEWMAEHTRRLQECQMLAGLDQGALRPEGKDFEFRGRRYGAAKVKRLLKQVDQEMADDRERLAALDRKVFLVHYQMGKALGEEVARELAQRYAVHLSVQEMLRSLSEQQARATLALQFAASRPQLSADELQGVPSVLRAAHRVVGETVSKARYVFLPSLKNVTAGDPLHRLLLAKDLIPEPGAGGEGLGAAWVESFMRQLAEARGNAERIQFKSLGGILTLQEQIAERWSALAAVGVQGKAGGVNQRSSVAEAHPRFPHA